MLGLDSTLNEDRKLVVAGAGLDSQTKRHVRRSVRRGLPIDDTSLTRLAVVYLEIYERRQRESQSARRMIGWLNVALGVLWVIIGILNLVHRHAGITWWLDFLVAATAFAVVALRPRLETWRVGRLAQSRSHLLHTF